MFLNNDRERLDFGRGLRLLPALTVVIIHILAGLQMRQPIILADELGYLGNARYLSGVSQMPDLVGFQFYHFGYSLFFVPLFWFFSNPVAVYRAALVLNAVMMGGLYLALTTLLSSFFNTSAEHARWIAFACCLYPSLLLYSSFALSENAFIPMYAVCVLLFGVLLQERSRRSAVIFGCAVGFLYTIHPRALPAAAATAVLLVLLFVFRILRASRVLYSLGAISMVGWLSREVNHHLNTVGWGGGGEFSAAKLAERVLPWHDFLTLIERSLGQILYLSLASHGLFLIGLAAILWLILKRVRSGQFRRILVEPVTSIPIFILLTSGGIFVASVTSKLYSLHSKLGVRGADIIHGRYNEAGAVLMIAVALSALCRKRIHGQRLGIGVMVVAVTMLALSAVVMFEVEDAQRRHTPGVPEEIAPTEVPAANVDPVNVPGIFPVVGVVGVLNLYWVALVSIVVLSLVAVVMHFSMRGAIAVLMLAFAGYAGWNHLNYRLAAERRMEPRLEFAAIAGRLGLIDELSYDFSFFDAEFFCAAQYLFPGTVFHRFSSGKGEEPRSQAVISSERWRSSEQRGARFVVAGKVCDNTLWLMPGELQDRLPVASTEGVVIGSKFVQFVRESGFHQREVVDGVAGRWTNGLATLHVPFYAERPPKLLGIEIMVPGRDGARLRVAANGHVLMDELIPAHTTKWALPLDIGKLEDEVVLEFESDAFNPAKSPTGNHDPRLLGVFIVAVRVESHESLAESVLDGLTLGVEPVFGVGESGFYNTEHYRDFPARWTDGTAALRVPVNPSHPPRALRIETAGPLEQPVQLEVLANGDLLWSREISLKRWKKTLSLDGVSIGDELLIELRSDTFHPPDVLEGSVDTRTLGLLVTGIRLER